MKKTMSILDDDIDDVEFIDSRLLKARKVKKKTKGTIDEDDDYVEFIDSRLLKARKLIYYDAMRESKLHCFQALETVNPIVEACEARTGNNLRRKRSIDNKFRAYE